MMGLGVDDIVRLELSSKASLRELDLLRLDLQHKADRGDLTTLATAMSNEHISSMDRHRALQMSVADVERAVRQLSQVVADQTGQPIPRQSALGRLPPQMLLAGGVALGAVAVKSPELFSWMRKL
jgi:hypothetical protein